MMISEGFRNYITLGHALVSLFDELKFTLPKKHYFDFGLRNLKAVTSHSGVLNKRLNGIEEEAMVVALVTKVHVAYKMPKDLAE